VSDSFVLHGPTTVRRYGRSWGSGVVVRNRLTSNPLWITRASTLKSCPSCRRSHSLTAITADARRSAHRPRGAYSDSSRSRKSLSLVPW
jgi:hypothetical protein